MDCCPRLMQPFVDRRVVRSPVKDRRVEIACRRADRRQFPIGEMRCEDDCWPALPDKLEKTVKVGWSRFDAFGPFRVPGIKVRKAIKVSKLSGDTAEVVPNAAQDRIDLGRRLFWKCRGQIGASNAVFGQERSDGSHEPPRDISHGVRIGQARQFQETNRSGADCGIGRAFDCALQAPNYPPHRRRLKTSQ